MSFKDFDLLVASFFETVLIAVSAMIVASVMAFVFMTIWSMT